MRVRAGQITVQSFALLFAVAMVAMSGYIAQYDLQFDDYYYPISYSYTSSLKTYVTSRYTLYTSFTASSLTYSLVDSTQYIGTNTYTYDSYNSSYTTFWTTAYTYTYMPVTTSSYTYYNERDLEQPTPIKKFKHVSKITEPGPRDTPVADATRDITPSSGPTAPPVPRVEVQSHKIRDADAADGHAGVPALEKRSKGGSSSSSSIFSSDLDSNYTSPLDTAGKLAKDEATVLIVLMIFGLLTIIWIVAHLNTSAKQPSSKFVRVKTDLAIIAVLVALGLPTSIALAAYSLRWYYIGIIPIVILTLGFVLVVLLGCWALFIFLYSRKHGGKEALHKSIATLNQEALVNKFGGGQQAPAPMATPAVAPMMHPYAMGVAPGLPPGGNWVAGTLPPGVPPSTQPTMYYIPPGTFNPATNPSDSTLFKPGPGYPSPGAFVPSLPATPVPNSPALPPAVTSSPLTQSPPPQSPPQFSPPMYGSNVYQGVQQNQVYSQGYTQQQ